MYHSTLGLRVIKRKKQFRAPVGVEGFEFRVYSARFMIKDLILGALVRL